MFRITRGMHVQHIHFPFPFIRDLDELEDDAPANAAPPEAAAPAPSRETAADGDHAVDADAVAQPAGPLDGA